MSTEINKQDDVVLNQSQFDARQQAGTLISGNTYKIKGTPFVNPITTSGDLIVGGTNGTPSRLPQGTSGQVLKMGNSAPEWQNETDTTYNAGDGIDINASNEISVKVGSGIFFDSNDAVALNSATQNAINSIPYKADKDAGNLTSGNVASWQSALNIYTVGSIYISTVNTSPASLFGGTWEQIQDRFLLSAGSSYTAGSTGGEATHTLTVNEIPSHTHTLRNTLWFDTESSTAVPGISAMTYDINGYIHWVRTGNTGANQPHNNMPPYLVVYMWKRTA